MPSPETTTLPGLPERVTVYEVGARDGLQNESAIVPVEVKAELVRQLVAAGLPAVELTSFVPPAWIPQLADAREVVASVDIPTGRRGVALVPNRRGLDDALAAGIREVAVVVSATDAFARANLNTDRAGAIARATDVVRAARAVGFGLSGRHEAIRRQHRCDWSGMRRCP